MDGLFGPTFDAMRMNVLARGAMLTIPFTLEGTTQLRFVLEGQNWKSKFAPTVGESACVTILASRPGVNI